MKKYLCLLVSLFCISVLTSSCGDDLEGDKALLIGKWECISYIAYEDGEEYKGKVLDQNFEGSILEITDTQLKEYRSNGTQTGWLDYRYNPSDQTITITGATYVEVLKLTSTELTIRNFLLSNAGIDIIIKYKKIK